LSARRIAVSGIQVGGNQPQPGFSTLSPVSSAWRDTQSGSTARSSRGPISASDKGASGAETKKPAPGFERMTPSATSRS